MEKFSLLDESITLDKARHICTNISFYNFEQYTNAWYYKKDIKEAAGIIMSLFNKGYSVMDILDSYFQFIKITTILTEDDKYRSINVICNYIALFHTLHEDEIELIFLTHDLLELGK